ncbi:MAG: PilZ domain-containing protein [Acidobacteriota bacterium]|nr:MAG: PilZ domain-containing protein [Acidobacteriota bacterium]
MLQQHADTTRPMASQAGTSPPEKENRRIQRISLPLPVRVEVRVDPKVSWYEVTRLNDVSAFGAGFVLKRPVKRGRIIQLTIPMPRQLRSFDYSEPQYKVWALVRRCIVIEKPGAGDEYAIGAAFIGRNPPADFLEHPSRLYDLLQKDESGAGFWHIGQANLLADDSHLPKDLRKQTRYSIPEELVLSQVDEEGNILHSETTVTENISLGGASVFSSFNVEAGTFLRVSSERFGVEILSVVRGSRKGDDGIPRLHLEFIDRLFPLEGIQ